MTNLWDKIENYLFDFIGLMLPGAYFFGCIFLIKVVIDNFQLEEDLFITNLISFVDETYTLFKSYLDDYFIFGALVIFFLLGHPIKVFAKHFYKIGEGLIDDFLLKGYQWLRNEWKWLNNVDKFLGNIHIKYIFKETFRFGGTDLHPLYSQYHEETSRLVKEYYNIELKDNWYPLYKLGTTVIGNEKLNSLHQLYLAKYNLYRSLAFISLIFGLLFYFSTDVSLLNDSNSFFISLINFSFFGLWFAFHSKYKRYWMLDGSDTLINLFYFLKEYENR